MAREGRHHPDLKGDRCPDCNGTGSTIVGGLFEGDCPTCHGTGLVNCPNGCIECGGSGKKVVKSGGLNFETTCNHCQGSGLEPVPA